jgi:class 3 adenylate cyclase
MGKVTALTPREVVRQDVEAIAAIYRNLGAPTAEKMVTRALGELALTMARLAETVRAQNLRDMADHLVRLSRLADDLGLVSLAEVARDSRLCLERADSTGFSAVWARLVRVAERSLSPHPGMADLSG